MNSLQVWNGSPRLGFGFAVRLRKRHLQEVGFAYKAYFGDAEMKVADVATVTPDDLPGTPTLVWGSFPCQDLSLAGNGAGLGGGVE